MLLEAHDVAGLRQPEAHRRHHRQGVERHRQRRHRGGQLQGARGLHLRFFMQVVDGLQQPGLTAPADEARVRRNRCDAAGALRGIGAQHQHVGRWTSDERMTHRHQHQLVLVGDDRKRKGLVEPVSDSPAQLTTHNRCAFGVRCHRRHQQPVGGVVVGSVVGGEQRPGISEQQREFDVAFAGAQRDVRDLVVKPEVAGVGVDLLAAVDRRHPPPAPHRHRRRRRHRGC